MTVIKDQMTSTAGNRQRLAGIATMALLVVLSTQRAHSFSTMPSLVPRSRAPLLRVFPQASSHYNTASSRRWEKPVHVEAEIVGNEDDVNKLLLKEMQMDTPVTYRKSTDPTPIFLSTLQKMNKKNASFIAMAALAFTLLLTPLPSMAAMSGGRMGGSFSAPSRSSSGSLSPRSYGGGYSHGFGSGFGGGYYSRGPSVMVTPFVNPFYSPFYSPGYYGGPGIITYSRGPGIFFTLFVMGGLALAASSALRNMGDGVTTSWDSSSNLFSETTSALGPGTSVVQVTIAYEVPDRDDPYSILSVLGRLSQTAQTDSRVGIQNLTSQVALELLRRKSSIVSAYTSYKHFNDRSKAVREYNSRSIQERGKFESETVSRYGGVDYSQGTGRQGSAASGKATMAVVTLLINIDGDSTKLPQIRSMSDVEEALRKIASDAKVDDCLQSAEILWTPEARHEILTQRDIVADYPELRSL